MSESSPSPVSSGRFAPGTDIRGQYRLERLLGQGGMGEVWEARQSVTRRKVAIKVLKPTAGNGVELRRRFLREARAACAVQHPNVVSIFEVLELEDGMPVMVMELLRGQSLEQVVQLEGKLPIGETAAIMGRVVSAVGAAHQVGIVHRDLKPDNIFLAQTVAGTEIKVLDFGIAKLTASEGDAEHTGGLTQTGAMLGTPYYMSPEQALGESNIDHRADVWSLGIMLYRCLSGVLPTQGENYGQILRILVTEKIPSVGTIDPNLPQEMVQLVDRMLSPDRRGRPKDLREVWEVLERFAPGAPGFGSPNAELLHTLETEGPPIVPDVPVDAVTPDLDRPVAGRARSRTWAFVAAGVALAGALVTVGVLSLGNQPVETADTVLTDGETAEAQGAGDEKVDDVAPVDEEPDVTPSMIPQTSVSASNEPKTASGGVPAPAGWPPRPTPTPAVTATAAADAPPVAPPPAPGGIVEETPF